MSLSHQPGESEPEVSLAPCAGEGQSLDTSTILKKGYSLRGLAADQNYLYYIDGTALTQRDLKSGTEKVILDRTGLNTFQMYNGYLVLTVSDNIWTC